MRNVFLFPLFPARVARDLELHPHLGPVFLVLSVLGMATVAISFDAVTAEVLRNLPENVSATDRNNVLGWLHEDFLRRICVEPILIIIRLSATAGLLLLQARISSLHYHPEFRQVLTVCAHAAVIASAASLLDGVFQHLPPLLRISTFSTLWNLIALSVGVRVLFRSSVRRSLLFTAIAWVLPLVFNQAVLRLISETMHLGR